jgi:hypothetical protein
MKIKPIVLGLLGVLISGFVQAMPVSFVFNLPKWTFVVAPSVYGSSGVLDFTIDNGASNIFSQTYLNNQITSIKFTTIGGSFSHTWIGGLSQHNGGLSQSYISTDADGVATLDLLASPSPTTAIVAMDGAYFLQLGRISLGGGFVSFFAGDGSSSIGYMPNDGHGNFTGFTVKGVGNGVIPEPESFALFGIALTGLVISRLKRA